MTSFFDFKLAYKKYRASKRFYRKVQQSSSTYKIQEIKPFDLRYFNKNDLAFI